MLNRSTTTSLAAILALGLAAFGACSDDSDDTGPMFGDLEFTPSFADMGSRRDTALILTNASTAEHGPILIGVDAVFPTLNPSDLSCSGDNSIQVTVAPSSISSLAPGEDATLNVTIDASSVDLNKCPPAQYDADIGAGVSSRVLGGATIRFDWDGSPP